MQQINSDQFKDEIFSKEELLKLLGKVSEEERMKKKILRWLFIDVPSVIVILMSWRMGNL